MCAKGFTAPICPLFDVRERRPNQFPMRATHTPTMNSICLDSRACSKRIWRGELHRNCRQASQFKGTLSKMIHAIDRNNASSFPVPPKPAPQQIASFETTISWNSHVTVSGDRQNADNHPVSARLYNGSKPQVLRSTVSTLIVMSDTDIFPSRLFWLD